MVELATIFDIHKLQKEENLESVASVTIIAAASINHVFVSNNIEANF